MNNLRQRYQQIVLDELNLIKDKQSLLVAAINAYCKEYLTDSISLPNIYVSLTSQDLSVQLNKLDVSEDEWKFYDTNDNVYFESDIEISPMTLIKIILNQL